MEKELNNIPIVKQYYRIQKILEETYLDSSISLENGKLFDRVKIISMKF